MFNRAFRFNWRITRLEYFLSYFLYYFIAVLCGFCAWLICGILDIDISTLPDDMWHIVVIPAYWFGLSQAVKRSHDIWKSGWWIIVPFFGLWLLFEDSQQWENIYGKNPKEKVNDVSTEMQEKKGE